MYIKAFIHGNSNEADAIKLFDKSVMSNFNKFETIEEIDRTYKNTQANLSGYHVFRELLPNSYNINHAILNFYQIGKSSLKNIILAHLIRYLCGNIYFTQLRIKEQLGYVTSGRVFNSKGNLVNIY